MAHTLAWHLANPDVPVISVGPGFRSVNPSVRERFNMWVTPTTLDKCWEWQGDRTNYNYGRIRIGGQSTGAHRVAFILAGGSLDMPSILHRCDNPPCCNYSHLFQGTNGDNVRDMMAKGRGWQQQKTHCKYGHEFATQNLIWKKDGSSFQCRICHNRVQREYQRGRSAPKQYGV